MNISHLGLSDGKKLRTLHWVGGEHKMKQPSVPENFLVASGFLSLVSQKTKRFNKWFVPHREKNCISFMPSSNYCYIGQAYEVLHWDSFTKSCNLVGYWSLRQEKNTLKHYHNKIGCGLINVNLDYSTEDLNYDGMCTICDQGLIVSVLYQTMANDPWKMLANFDISWWNGRKEPHLIVIVDLFHSVWSSNYKPKI